MRSNRKSILRLLALGVAGGTSVWVAVTAADLIASWNRDAISRALAEDGHDWVVVETDGLIATLSGTAPDEAARFRALRAAGDQANPAHLRDAMTVAPPDNLPAPVYRLELLRNGQELTALGLLPGGIAAQQALHGRIGEQAEALTLRSLVTAGADAAPEGWGDGLDAAIDAAVALTDAQIELTPGRLSVTGRAPDRSAAEALEDALRAALPPQISLALELSVPRPVLSPFVMRFRIDDGAPRFDACAASSSAGAAQIRAAALAAGLAAADVPCIVAHGAPDDEWDSVAADAVAALGMLGSGAVTLSDLTVTLAPGEGARPAALDNVRLRLEEVLPPDYRLLVPGASEAGTEGGTATVAAPTFSATRSPEGFVQVRGPVPDTEAGSVLEGFAAARFDERHLTVALRPRDDLPDGWSLRVIAGLDAFGMLDSGRLNVTPAMILIRGVTGDPGLAADLAARLSATLGPSSAVRLEIAYREKLDPVAALPTAEECLDRIRGIQERQKITFAPGETALDGPALSVVRRIAAVLRDCDGVAMEIGGHTDSQGRDEMNQSLSQARADAVLNALMTERVRIGSLTAIGYGETLPVADNATEDGREANRRIEFNLIHPLQGPPAPGPQDAAQTEEAGNGPD